MKPDYTVLIAVRPESIFAMSDGHSYVNTNFRLQIDSGKARVTRDEANRMLRADDAIIRHRTAYVKIGGAGKAIVDATHVDGVHIVPALDGSVVGRFGKYHVRLIQKGDRYGRDDCLAWEEDEPGIEFYLVHDNYDERIDGRGWFVSRYYLQTLVDGNTAQTGLCLDGGNNLSIGSADLKCALNACQKLLDVGVAA